MVVIIRESCPNCNSSNVVYHGNIRKQCEDCRYLYSDPFVETCQLGHTFVVTSEDDSCPRCTILARLPENQSLFYQIIMNLRDQDYSYRDIADIFSVDFKRIDNVIQLEKNTA